MSKYDDQRKERKRWADSEPAADEHVYIGTRRLRVLLDFEQPSPSGESAVQISMGDETLRLSVAEAVELAHKLLEWCDTPKEQPHA